MRPVGLGDELRAALVVDSTCWGYLCLHRSDHPLGFTAKEAALIARIGPHIAHALRQAVLLEPAAAVRQSQPPGVVLLSDDLDAVAVTPEAEELLSLAQTYGTFRLELPVAVYTVAAALRDVERGSAHSEMQPSIRVRTRDGHWLNLHASRLLGPPGLETIAVVVEPVQPTSAAAMLLAAYGLSPRESEVARLVLRGESTPAMSNALHISAYTLQDHLKTIFDKVGVRSRRELVGRLLSGGAHRT
jgi:DNA-binding CsgD family transcriptional regulator